MNFRVLSTASLIGVVVVASGSQAETFQAGPFTCMPVASLSAYSGGSDDLRFNNFSITERPSRINKSLTVLELTYSVVNRGTRDVQMDGQFMLLDNKAGGATAAFSAGPLFDTVGQGKTDLAKGDTYVDAGALERADGICLRIVSSSLQQ